MSLESGCSEMEAWYAAGAEDDFNLMFPLLPDHWLNFAKLVEPELQRRGLTRKEYAGGTVRDRLGCTLLQIGCRDLVG
jgi:hypothetical protein